MRTLSVLAISFLFINFLILITCLGSVFLQGLSFSVIAPTVCIRF